MTFARRILLIPLGVLLWSVVVAASQQSASATDPVIHFPPLPPSIPQLVKSVDVVVLGRVVGGSDPRVETDGLGRRTVRRYQHVQVLELIKGPDTARPNSRLVVRQGGGTAHENGKAFSEQIIQRLLKPGDTVVLFLSPVPAAPDTYYITLGPSGVLVVEDKEVSLTPQMQQMTEFLHRKRIPIDEFLGLLRGAA